MGILTINPPERFCRLQTIRNRCSRFFYAVKQTKPEAGNTLALLGGTPVPAKASFPGNALK